MHAMIMDERSFVASSSCQSGLHAVFVANNWELKKIYYWWCQLLKPASRLKLLRYSCQAGFMSGFMTLSLDFANWNLQQFIVNKKVRRCKIRYSYSDECHANLNIHFCYLVGHWTHRRGLITDQVHNKSQKRYNIQHIQTKNGPCTSDQVTMSGRSC